MERLEQLISQRDQQVNAALADFQADGVSEDYRSKELVWRSCADEVRGIIGLVRETLAADDDAATAAQQRARGHVQGM